MLGFSPISQRAERVARHGCGVLLLTSVHHAYGAYIYKTPWRFHIVFVSVLAAVCIIGSMLALQRLSSKATRKIAFGIFTAATLVIPFAGVGVFEGGYNHAIKDAIYFMGSSPMLMHRLFPPPMYEMPNDWFFEITGVLQLVYGIATGYLLYHFVEGWWRADDEAYWTPENRSHV